MVLQFCNKIGELMNKAGILIVEDHFITAEDIATTLGRLGYEVLGVCSTAEEAIERMKVLRPNIALIDVHIKGEIDGIQLAAKLKSEYDVMPIYLTADSEKSTILRAADTEPQGYILKPFNERQLYTTIELALNRKRVERHQLLLSSSRAGSSDAASSRSEAGFDDKEAFADIVGCHASMLQVFERVALVAKTDVSVHIYGENGTGKELIADSVHRLSTRKNAAFLKINCSAIPTNLLESALFGHVKGAFTGAIRDQAGFVETTENGTLFLDEIGDISHEIQVKLLRLLQSHEYSKVGDVKVKTANIRIITATNRNLLELVKEGKIREDFYYRINVFPLIVPALRDRTSDILLIADHFRCIFNHVFSKNIVDFSQPTKDLFMNHDWPGNVRELENAIKHAFIVASGDQIEPEHLPAHVLIKPETAKSQVILPFAINYSYREPHLERRAIEEALLKTKGSKTAAARLLGYSRVTLWKKMNKLGLNPSKVASEERNLDSENNQAPDTPLTANG